MNLESVLAIPSKLLVRHTLFARLRSVKPEAALE